MIEKRHIYQSVKKRLEAPRHLIQALLGPRQVGKTTLVNQILEELSIPSHYATADEVTLQDIAWLEYQWLQARELAEKQGEAVLVLDEIQKILDWSSVVKRLWDEDNRNKVNLKVVALGSSPWLVNKGLKESLAGRFEIIPMTHWTYSEMQKSFGWTIEQYIYFGGYPGAAPLINDETRWKRYINDALIETTISRDILLMTQVNKPALLRRLFQLGCHYSGQVLSFQKMLGQLQDAGNTVTLAHYLELLEGAGMLAGIEKYAGQEVRRRGSSPKFNVFNTALLSAQKNLSFEEAKNNKEEWGRFVESAVGAHLLNAVRGTSIQLYYWREGDKEVDFVLTSGEHVTAIEVKSGTKRETLSGMQSFIKAFNPDRVLLIGQDGVSLEEFFQAPIDEWV